VPLSQFMDTDEPAGRATSERAVGPGRVACRASGLASTSATHHITTADCSMRRPKVRTSGSSARWRPTPNQQLRLHRDPASAGQADIAWDDLTRHHVGAGPTSSLRRTEVWSRRRRPARRRRRGRAEEAEVPRPGTSRSTERSSTCPPPRREQARRAAGQRATRRGRGHFCRPGPAATRHVPGGVRTRSSTDAVPAGRVRGHCAHPSPAMRTPTGPIARTAVCPLLP
jgi:hypothetical protein